jgi:3-hydroxyacyl-[acyl-carrier-protein] dehydratase
LTPHGPGFCFIDEFERAGDGSGIALLRLDPGAAFFADHFPGDPLMPAVLLVECAAQAAGVLWMSGEGDPRTPVFLASIDQFRVLAPVLPGSTLRTVVRLLKDFGALAQFEVESHVLDVVVARGRITLSRRVAQAS